MSELISLSLTQNLKADRDVLATLLEKLTSEKNDALQMANRLVQLLRDCHAKGRHRTWVSDMSCIHTPQGCTCTES